MRTQEVDIATHKATLQALHTLTFPHDEQPQWLPNGRAWITYDQGEAVAFLYASPQLDGSWYFARVGVLSGYRGRGLQRKLMQRMEKALRGNVLVSTTLDNPASANNFIRQRWLTYLPAAPWGAPGTVYWYKEVP